MPNTKIRISAFSTVLVMLVLMTIGAGVIPLLSLQFTPSEKKLDVMVSFSWHNASAKVIEQEVTCKIEGVLAGIKGVREITSHSYKGRGSVSLTLKKGTNIGAVRFEISSLIRQIYPKLPEGVSYPSISLSAEGYRPQSMLVYTFNANMTPLEIQRYVERYILTKLSRIQGINNTNLSGANPFYYEVAFDSNKMRVYGISTSDIQSALQLRYGTNRVAGSVTVEEDPGSRERMVVRLESGGQTTDLENLYIKTVNGREFYLGELARVNYKEELPSSYFRLNGLNTIDMVVYPERGVNVLALAQKVKKVMRDAEADYPPDFTSLLRRDTSKNIVKELNKIFVRTALTMLILFIFVFVVSRSWRYLGIIALTLVANILISFIFFYLFNVSIHIYAMAGVTVSLGLVIDSSIIMIDHYGYYRNRKAFLSILAALLTTVGALLVVFFLPEATKLMLADFSMVIIICLCVSLAIAWFFVPILVDRYPIRKEKIDLSDQSRRKFFRRRRRQVRLSQMYVRTIVYLRRWRWALLVMCILGFGLPIQFLPNVLKDSKGVQEKEGWRGFYNKTVGGNWYQTKAKKVFEPILGGSLRLFTKNSSRLGFRDPSRLSISIRAYMPEGSTVEQMNTVMKGMENYLSQYNQIEMYETTVQARSASMTVTFKKEYEHTSFPLQLREEIIYRCIISGAANWQVSGIIEQPFSNVVHGMGNSMMNQIVFTGYNYDKLYELATSSAERLKENRRITKTLVYSQADNSRENETNTEFYINYNQEQIAFNRWSLNSYHSYLKQQLFDTRVATLYENGVGTGIRLTSAQKEEFDVWHIENDLLEINGRQLRLSALGSIDKRRTGNNIYKVNQQYELRMGFDFVGTNTLSNKVLNDELQYLKTILPVGYKAEKPVYGGWWNPSNSKQYWLLFLIIAVVYFICSILFESLKQPFIIVSLIPLSFIGVFLTFYLFGFYFDQGGFASMILLCAIVVNSGIYFINEFNLIARGSGDASKSLRAGNKEYRKRIRLYVKAFNHKIIPVSLTIISTVLGLIPFVLAGPKEVFWFSFAVGAMGGMLFSFVALFIYLPAFLPIKK